jgi:brefeldin A-resistance guanine nucleotide exchange factor 1
VSNESVVEMFQACLRICFEKVLSELLRKTAEHVLAEMTYTLFSGLEDMVDNNDVVSALVVREEALAHPQTADGIRVLPFLLTTQMPLSLWTLIPCAHSLSHRLLLRVRGRSSCPRRTRQRRCVAVFRVSLLIIVSITNNQSPYGVPCIRELLRFLVLMINRRDRANSDSVITLGLNLLTVALEAGGAGLNRFPTIMEVRTCIAPLIFDYSAFICRSFTDR